MSLALRWGLDTAEDGGFIYFDAVILYTQNYKGSVTKHPIDSGGNITDHFIRDNPSFRISGVITGADISPQAFAVRDVQENAPFNSQPTPTPVSVNSTDQSLLTKFIPASINQFLPVSTPEVVMDGPRQDVMELVRDQLVELMNGKIFNEKTEQFDPNIQIVRLYEYDGIMLRTVIPNLVMTNISFREDANTGYALYCDISFEQVTFALLKKTTIPRDVSASISKKSENKASKGKQDSTPQDLGNGTSPPKDTDPLRQAIDNG